MKKNYKKIRKQKRIQEKESKWWCKLFRFFVPKNWKLEIQKGREIGSTHGIAKTIGKGMYGVGKLARKAVDPEHKMKIGDQKEKKR